MREKSTFNFVRHFLRNSPRNQLTKYKKAFEMPNVQLQLGITPLSNRSYLLGFLKSVEVFGQPASEVKMPNIQNQVSIQKILKQQRMAYKPYETAHNQTQQILLCIKQMTGPFLINLNHYHELQQRIVIAQTETIMEVRQKLTYLFKILLNKRDSLPPQSLDLDANLQLTEAIIKAFARNSEFGQNNKEWSKLQAMDKFMRARQYKKKGYHSVAINSFEQIFRDDAATYQIRLQALKLLCNEGEQQGDVSKLEHLVSFTHQKGEKQYEEYLKIMIQKIKGNLPQKTSES